ncbi:MAG: hypothetical protein Q8R36_02940 [bacterium]|nr:hypothetical protein [bacterium]
MEHRQSYYIIGFLVFVGAISLFYYVYVGKITENVLPYNTNTATTTAKNEVGEEVSVEFVEITQDTNKNNIETVGDKDKTIYPIPNLARPAQVPASTPEAQKNEITNKINIITALLRADPNLFNEWLDLGLLRKSIEDYEGAKEAWEYASLLRPKNSLSFSNLGMLYGYYIKNPLLGEKNHLKAIENDSKLPYLYMQVADFYMEVLNQPARAREILQKGLQMIPGDDGLENALNNL